MIADDRRIVRHGEHRLVGEADADGVLFAAEAPGIAVLFPVVGGFLLRAVFEALLEKAEAVTQAVAAQRHAAGGGAVHIARGKTAQTSVAESGVRLFLEYVGRIAAHILERAGHSVRYAEVEGVFHKAAAHQELHGHIVHFFVCMSGVLCHEKPAHYLAYDYRRGLKYLIVGRVCAGHAEVSAQLILYCAAYLVA